MMKKKDNASDKKETTKLVLKIVSITLLVLILLGASGLAVYGFIRQPEITRQQVESYFQEHKDELKGEKGDRGEDGLNGINGRDGASYNNGGGGSLSCSSWDSGNYIWTDCY